MPGTVFEGSQRERGAALLLTLVVVLALTGLVAAQFSVVQKNVQQSRFFASHESMRMYAEAGLFMALHDWKNDYRDAGPLGTTAWTPANDLGRDGAAGTSDLGEGDGMPSPGEPNVVPQAIGPANLGIRFFVYAEDSSYLSTRRLIGTAFDDEVEAIVELFARSATVPRIAAVYIPPSTTITFGGQVFEIHGQDTNPDFTAGPEGDHYALSTSPGSPAGSNASALSSQIDSSQTDQVTGQGLDPSVGEAGGLVDVDYYFEDYKSRATLTLGPGSYGSVTWGTPAAPEITYINGDASVSGLSKSAGVLLVDGNLTISGKYEHQGLIIVRGDVDMSGGGTGVHIWGSLWMTGSNFLTSGVSYSYYSSQALDLVDSLSSSGTGYTVLHWSQLK